VIGRRLGFCLALVGLLACSAGSKVATTPERGGETLSPAANAFLDTLSERTFHYFWDLSDSMMGLTPDRSPTKSFISVGAVGFALTAYPIGAEHGWVTRAAAAERVRRTLRFFRDARQDTARAGSTGYRGFFYHFLDPKTGQRFETVELSTMDTALLLAGALFCQSYFDRDEPLERDVRELAEAIYRRVDWRWAQPRPPLIALGWSPEEGHLPYDWGGLNETMLLHVLALGSPSHGVDPAVWPGYAKHYRWGTFQGQEHLGFAPLFGHQYSHVWIDFRGIRDPYMRGKGIDYFENSRRATYAQRGYAIANPSGFRGYDEDVWGLTACDGPLDAKRVIDGREREFHTYEARGACHTRVTDDGTISPSAAGGSIAFAPEICLPALMAMRERYGDHVYRRYGFVDAFNPTLDDTTRVPYGKIVPGVGWFDDDYLGIDQGPILAMIANYTDGAVWQAMSRCAQLRRGLKRAGFAGGWLEEG